MAHATDFPEGSDTLELSAPVTGDHGSYGGAPIEPAPGRSGFEAHGQGPDRPANTDLEKATDCEESAQRLSFRIAKIEDSIRLTRMFLSASAAIEELLVESRRMLEKGRQLTDPSSRKALADTYRIIKNQINDIVAEAGFNDQNLAAGDVLEVAFDEADAHRFQIGSDALSISALGLAEYDGDFASDAEIIETIVQIEQAINTVRTRRTVTEMVLSVLASRAKFAGDKIASLRSASQFLTEPGKAYGAICEIAASRVARAPAGKPEQGSADGLSQPHRDAMAVPRESAEDMAATDACDDEAGVSVAAQSRVTRVPAVTRKIAADEPDAHNDNDELNQLAKGLARFLKQGSYLTRWFKYEEGETGTFAHLLAQSYGPELIAEAAQKYDEHQQFRKLADRYMSKFEAWLDDVTDDQPDRKAKIDEFLKTDQGTVYVVLARACGRV